MSRYTRTVYGLWVSGILSVAWCTMGLGAEPNEALKDWENPRLTVSITCRRTLRWSIYPDMATAHSIQLTVNKEREKSRFYRSLNGTWKYHYSKNHSERVADFWTPDFDDSKRTRSLCLPT